MADNDRDLKRKRRKARAALVILRRNISSICGKAINAADFYDKLAAYTAPVMSEFGDVLPSDSRSHMDGLMELITERREEAEIACNLCKGQVDAAIKGVAAQLGVQGAILSALRPIEKVAPQWLVEGPFAEVAAAFVVLLVGGGIAASIAVLASGGGTEEDSSAVTASSPTSVETDSGDGDEAEATAAGEAFLGSGVATVGNMEFPFNVTLCSRESVHGPTTESATQAGYVRVFVGDGSSPVAWVAIGGSEDSPDQGDPTYQSLAQNTGELSATNIVYEFGEQLSISFSEQFVERGPLDPPTMPGNVELTCDSELLQ